MLFIGLLKFRFRIGCPKEHGAIREKTMSRIRALLVLILCALAQQLFLSVSSSAQGIPQNIPRKELLILENPEGTIKNAGWFNIWAINAGSQSNGLQQAALDTLWYIDPESGLDGVWSNSLAADKPQYNADFTEMTAKLRNGIFWSDGVEFTADDVISTAMTPTENGTSGNCVTTGSAPRSRVTASPVPNTSLMSIPVRRTSG